MKWGYEMEYVQPIRSLDTINLFKEELMKTGYRNYMIFVLGINTGLRISDILPLKVKDVQSDYLIKTEKKTGKTIKFLINNKLRSELELYTRDMGNYEYLFKSRKGNKPLSRIQAYRILNYVAEELGMDEIGTHTMRKTFGYWHYKQYKDVVMLQEIFNHASPSITLRYIGITQDIKDETIKDFYLQNGLNVNIITLI